MRIFLLFILFFASHVSSLRLPNAISSNMVLQRAPVASTIWGWAASNTPVNASINGKLVAVTYADSTGNFSLTLPPMPASTTPASITVTGDATNIVLDNILFGDVYLCSGQSNMQFTLNLSFNGPEAVANSINYPYLRLYGVAENTSYTPLQDNAPIFSDGSQWVVSQPKYAGGAAWSFFSATCFYFGTYLYDAINGGKPTSEQIPIGLIESCVGGTYVEAWTSPDGLNVCGPASPGAAEVSKNEKLASWNQQEWLSDADVPNILGKVLKKPSRTFLEVEEKVSAGPDPNTPSVLYNAMINPLLPMRIQGAVWYQGEQNQNNATNYACRFPAMIRDWRDKFQIPYLNFYFALLAAYKEGNDWPDLRAAQMTALSLMNTGTGSAQDLGDESSPEGAIHPRNKSVVGQRLALNAQVQIYGQNVTYQGPEVLSIIWPLPKTGIQSVVLRFDPSLSRNQGLHLIDTAGCSDCCKGSPAFALKTNTGALITNPEVNVLPDAAMIVVTADLSSSPGSYVTQVSHDWVNYPECSLYNSANLPFLPFNATNS